MEVAGRRFGIAFSCSAALHTVAVLMLMRTVAPGPAPMLEPALIQVDLRFLETGALATAPVIGPTRVAPAPPASIPQASLVEVAPLPPSRLPPSPARKDPPAPPARAPEPPARLKAKPVAAAPAAPALPAPDDASSASDEAGTPSSSAASVASRGGAPAGASGPIGNGPGSSAPNPGTTVRIRYEQQLYVWLARFKEYPMLARRRGLEGTGSVRVRLDRHGRVLTRSVDKSTGERLLDDAAVDMTRRADPFPPVPADYPGDSFEFVAPIEFRLR